MKSDVGAKTTPGLDRVNMSMPVGVPLNMWLEQHERLTKEVMPAFKARK
ncbi:MAG: hypothetical protein HC868_02140 [Sphingomonadales bacterium]|nr:hypothetical protein [Sphingomonadales bacterium]